jgi:ankyrin repeat protein
MVGFSLFHSGLGILGVLFAFLSGVWALIVVSIALFKRTRISSANVALLALLAACIGLLFVPYEQWKLLMVRANGTKDVPKDWVTYAAATGEVRLLEYLLANGFDVNTRDQNGQSALGAAAVEGKTDIGRLLITRGARLDNRTDSLLETPLTQAAQMNRTEMVKLLLEHGADSSERDKTGRTALEWANKNGNSEMASLLQTPLKK